MRKIEVKYYNNDISIFVGKVDQSGDYEVLTVKEAEAALIFMELKRILKQ